MPKTTKTTRKTSTASSKKVSLKSRFSLRSKKVQFFVVIIFVALLGGGYYVYKSSAAGTIVSTNYSIGKGVRVSSSNGCTSSDTFTEPSKNNMRIAVLSCPGKNNQLGDGRAEVSVAGQPAGTYRACFTAKGGGTIYGHMIGLRAAPVFYPRLSSTELAKINSNGFTKVCTEWVKTASPLTSIYMTIGLRDTKAGILAVSFITLERQ